MPLINDEEIFARVHKFKLFRKEGNIFIDLYEAMLGKPAHKYIAVPNLDLEEADKEYFGVGDSKSEALKDCLKKIKDVPISAVVQRDTVEKPIMNSEPSLDSGEEFEFSQSSWSPFKGKRKPEK
jgi:hypothetical protein